MWIDVFQLSCLTSFYKHDYTHRHNCNYCIYYNLLLYILFLTHLSKLSRLVGCYAGIDNFLNITIHNLIKLIKCKTYSMVCYTSLWEVVSSYLLSSVSSTYLASSCICFCIVCFLWSPGLRMLFLIIFFLRSAVWKLKELRLQPELDRWFLPL